MSDLLIGDSVPMRRLRAFIARIAASTLPVLIEGETGSGKELVARALHEWSGRSGRLVALNVCAVSDSMFEASMFGHVRGAFTGALRDSAGYLTEAHGGTLFLDEVSGLSIGNQAKLLRAIETREFRPVGGCADQRSDFRLVAASNESVATLVERRQLRPDLAHRLGGLHLRVPPLRERLEDVPALAMHFAMRGRGMPTDAVIVRGAMRVLQSHSWPGNVRELRHVVEASIALSGGQVTAHDVATLIRPDLQDAGKRPSDMRGRRDGRDRELLLILERCAWDVSEVASELGIHRATVYRRLGRLGVGAPLAARQSRSGEGSVVR
jgi:DNA-binding NtrC family response regulator